MRKNNRVTFVGHCVARLLLVVIAQTTYAAKFEKSVVMVEVSQQKINIDSPWEGNPVEQQRHLGTIINEGILMTAYAVKDAKYIKMKKFAGSVFYDLKVELVDFEVNLALLKPVDDTAIKDLKPLQLGDDIAKQTDVTLLVRKDDFSLRYHQLKLDDVQGAASTTSSYTVPNYQIRTQKKPLGWSEPVISNGRLVAVTSGQSDEFVYAIPSRVIKHFLKDKKDGTYDGFPGLGLGAATLESIPFRKYLGAEAFENGVRVIAVRNDSPFKGVVDVNDIILEIDGEKITNQGTFEHPKWGHLSLQNIFNNKFTGDEVEITFIKDGKVQKAKKKLMRFDSNAGLIPYSRYGKPEPHVIFGGLLFQELTLDYIKTWGRDWKSSAPSHFIYLWNYKNDDRRDDKNRLIILNKVLADIHNRGYDKLDNAVVEKINNQEIFSLEDLRKAFQKPLELNGERFARIELALGQGEIILSYKGLKRAHQRIAKRYGIGQTKSFFQLQKAKKTN